MKIMIAGSGAMGCRYGAALFEAGHQVVRLVGLLEATWPRRVNSVHSG